MFFHLCKTLEIVCNINFWQDVFLNSYLLRVTPILLISGKNAKTAAIKEILSIPQVFSETNLIIKPLLSYFASVCESISICKIYNWDYNDSP